MGNVKDSRGGLRGVSMQIIKIIIFLIWAMFCVSPLVVWTRASWDMPYNISTFGVCIGVVVPVTMICASLLIFILGMLGAATILWKKELE